MLHWTIEKFNGFNIFKLQCRRITMLKERILHVDSAAEAGKKAYILYWISSIRLFHTEDEMFCYWILNAKLLSFASIHPFIECSFGHPCHFVDIIHFICIYFLGIFTSSLPAFECWILLYYFKQGCIINLSIWSISQLWNQPGKCRSRSRLDLNLLWSSL